jgi:hypothetical protein
MAEDPWAEFRVTKPATGGDEFAEFRPREAPSATADFFKQLGAGLVTGVEAIPAFPAQAMGFLGRQVERVLPPSEQEAQNREALRQLVEAQRKGGIAQYLPEPQTTAGQFGRTIGEFIPSTVGATKGAALGRAGISVPTAAGVGAATGAAAEAAGQAAEAAGFEEAAPYARVGGAFVAGPLALRAAGTAARQAIPSIEALEQRGGQLYSQFRQSGFGIDPKGAPTYSQSVKVTLADKGLDDQTAKQVWAALDRFETHPFTTPQQYHSAYQKLGNIARGAENANERLAANIAQERLLQFLENPPPWLATGAGDTGAAARLLTEANMDWAAAQRAKGASQRIGKAEQRAAQTYSGLNLENQLRSRVGAISENYTWDEIRRAANAGRNIGGYTPQEMTAIKRFAEGTRGQNILRFIGTGLGGGGGSVGLGAGGIVGGGAGGLASYLAGGDPYAGAIYGATAPLAGIGMRVASNKMALARARDIETMLRARSALAQRQAGARDFETIQKQLGPVPLPTQGLPPYLRPSTAAFGGPIALQLEETGEGYPFYAPRTLGDLGR